MKRVSVGVGTVLCCLSLQHGLIAQARPETQGNCWTCYSGCLIDPSMITMQNGATSGYTVHSDTSPTCGAAPCSDWPACSGSDDALGFLGSLRPDSLQLGRIQDALAKHGSKLRLNIARSALQVEGCRAGTTVASFDLPKAITRALAVATLTDEGDRLSLR